MKTFLKTMIFTGLLLAVSSTAYAGLYCPFLPGATQDRYCVCKEKVKVTYSASVTSRTNKPADLLRASYQARLKAIAAAKKKCLSMGELDGRIVVKFVKKQVIRLGGGRVVTFNGRRTRLPGPARTKFTWKATGYWKHIRVARHVTIDNRRAQVFSCAKKYSDVPR